MSPTPEQIVNTRINAGLTQTQAEMLIYHKNTPGSSSTLWSRYETGIAKIKVATWELFLLKIDGRVKIEPWMEIKPSPEQIKQLRINSGLSQTKAAGMLHKSLRPWQNYETGDRQMDIAHWVLFQLKLNQLNAIQPPEQEIETPPTPGEIRQAREAAGLTEEQAAVMVHRSTRSWQFYEEGKRKMGVYQWRLFLEQINSIK